MSAPVAIQGERTARLTIEELAVRRQLLSTSSSGIAFARKKLGEEKNLARQQILSAFAGSDFPQGLSILTMPGLTWHFERQLLNMRETSGRLGRIYDGNCGPRRTYITSIEREEDLFRLALKKMPGADKSLVITRSAVFSTASVRTNAIKRFHRCSFEDLAKYQEHFYDAAWLDFCGSLSAGRATALIRFWNLNLRSRLAITLNRGRANANIASDIRDAGGLESFLLSILPGASLVSSHTYDDGVPMLQLIIDKAAA